MMVSTETLIKLNGTNFYKNFNYTYQKSKQLNLPHNTRSILHFFHRTYFYIGVCNSIGYNKKFHEHL